jgi:hypothetical protein
VPRKVRIEELAEIVEQARRHFHQSKPKNATALYRVCIEHGQQGPPAHPALRPAPQRRHDDALHPPERRGSRPRRRAASLLRAAGRLPCHVCRRGLNSDPWTGPQTAPRLLSRSRRTSFPSAS